MTLVMRCNACGAPITDGSGKAVPSDLSVFVEVAFDDQRRHYHRQPVGSRTVACWEAVREGLTEVEGRVRSAA